MLRHGRARAAHRRGACNLKKQTSTLLKIAAGVAVAYFVFAKGSKPAAAGRAPGTGMGPPPPPRPPAGMRGLGDDVTDVASQYQGSEVYDPAYDTPGVDAGAPGQYGVDPAAYAAYQQAYQQWYYNQYLPWYQAQQQQGYAGNYGYGTNYAQPYNSWSNPVTQQVDPVTQNWINVGLQNGWIQLNTTTNYYQAIPPSGVPITLTSLQAAANYVQQRQTTGGGGSNYGDQQKVLWIQNAVAVGRLRQNTICTAMQYANGQSNLRNCSWQDLQTGQRLSFDQAALIGQQLGTSPAVMSEAQKQQYVQQGLASGQLRRGRKVLNRVLTGQSTLRMYLYLVGAAGGIGGVQTMSFDQAASLMAGQYVPYGATTSY